MAFPVWNLSGVIPPIRPGVAGHHPDRSPYKSNLLTFIDYFCFSKERVAICEGYLEFRGRLHEIGLTKGFQWLNGSFSEDVETNEGRPPGDLDIVTFFELPTSFDPASFSMKTPDLADLTAVKTAYKIDGYYNQLGLALGGNEVERISYWYSLWSHRRDGLWKGFVQVDLSSHDDSAASQRLSDISAQLGIT